MAEQNKNEIVETTQKPTPAQIVGKAPVNWSMDLIKGFTKSNPGVMNSESAQRCAMSAISKVIGFMTEQRMAWEEVDISGLSRIILRLSMLELDADAGDWYAYSRKNKNTGLQQFDPNPSYNGERKLRIKYSIGSFGKIKDIQAVTIREGDVINIKRDLFGKCESIDYQPIPFNKGEVIGYLGITIFEDDTIVVKEFSVEKILEYKKANPNGGSPAWDKWPDEMAHAKVVKHTAKDYAYTIPSAVKTIITELDTKDIEEQADQLEATESIDITPGEEPKEIEAPAEKAEEKKKAKAEQKVEPQLDLTEMPNLQ